MTKLVFFLSPYVPIGMRVTMTKFYLYFEKESSQKFYMPFAFNEVCNLFGFNVIIFHSSQFETFLSSIQLNYTHSDFYFRHKKYIY